MARSRKHGVRALLDRVGLGGKRRGVVAVVSMMFLILFGSLAAAMAIMSRSNIVTAATHQHVTRALGAAETGLAVAQRRLSEAVSRFPVAKGTIDEDFGKRIWTGDFLGSDGAQLPALAPTSFITTLGDPEGVAEAVGQAHAQDTNTIEVQGIDEVTIGPAPAGVDPDIYELDNWVRTPAVALTAQTGEAPANTAFQVDYAPLASGTADAGWLYAMSRRGDVVEYTGTDRWMTLENGYGDWNLSFPDYQAGSALS